MSIEDFTRLWSVFESGVRECSFDDGIEIVKCKPEDPEDTVVKVTCIKRSGDNFIYPTGMYNKSDNTITGEGYKIELQIKFSEQGGRGGITGSWTANDTAGGIDGDG
jgi:hypothetical protein